MDEVFVPVLGMAPDDVVLVSWLKQPGEKLASGDPVAVIETSKAELDLESPADGVLGQHLFPERSTVAPGTVIARILAVGEEEPAPSEEMPVPAGITMDGAPAAPEISGAEATDPAAGAQALRHTLSPRQRRLQAEAATRAEATAQTEAGDIATSPTVPVALMPAAAAHVDLPLAERFRAAVGASVTRSWQEIPHFAVTRELHVDTLVEAVRQWRVVLPALTLTDLLLRGLALSLLERERTSDLDVGLAVATDRGVAVPVIRQVLRLGLVELVSARLDAVRRAREGRLHRDDGRVPASTLSNLGAVGVDHFTGVVPYGQTSLLTIGRAAPRPVVDPTGALAVATTMHATLNVDHRSWDGYHAAEVLDRLARVLAEPAVFVAIGTPMPSSGPSEDRSAGVREEEQ